jgi:hypothetical protein
MLSGDLHCGNVLQELVERSLAWLLANRCLTVRDERRADILTAFLHLAH